MCQVISGDTTVKAGLLTPRRIVLGATVDSTVNVLLAPLIAELVVRGWEVHVVCAPGVVRLASPADRAVVHHIPMSRRISPIADSIALSAWIRLLAAIQPTVVMGGTPKAATLSMVAARITRVPVRIFHARGARWEGVRGHRGRVLRSTDRITAYAANEVIAVSASLADEFVRRGVVKGRPTVLGSGGSKGVDTTLFHPPHSSVTDSAPVIGFVGRLAQDKGVSDALACFRMCQRIWPDAKMVMVGDVDEGQPVGQEVLHQVNGDSVAWHRFGADVAEIMRTFDVLLLPSLREGLPNVVIEAAACGVPTVAYDVVGVRDAIVNGKTGLMVRVGDVAALARAVAEVVGADSYSTAARELAVTKFDQAVVVGLHADHLDVLHRRATVDS